MENKRSLGGKKEALAAEYLKGQGAEVLCQNFYFHGGELDIVAKHGEYLCFIEVKYRRNREFGYPEEAVTKRKQQKMVQGARRYLYQNQLSPDTACRFDVVSIYKGEILWIQDAFQ